jgi:cell division protein ZapA (FtsZ GTPase activity inhibitor)
MDELIPINVVIGDRSYRVKVAPRDEEVVRKTMRLINDKMIEFKSQFAGKDMQDYLGMVLLWFATQESGSPGIHAQEEMGLQLEKLEALIDKALGN